MQGLVNKEGVVKLLTSVFAKNLLQWQTYGLGHYHVEVRHV